MNHEHNDIHELSELDIGGGIGQAWGGFSDTGLRISQCIQVFEMVQKHMQHDATTIQVSCPQFFFMFEKTQEELAPDEEGFVELQGSQVRE